MTIHRCSRAFNASILSPSSVGTTLPRFRRLLAAKRSRADAIGRVGAGGCGLRGFVGRWLAPHLVACNMSSMLCLGVAWFFRADPWSRTHGGGSDNSGANDAISSAGREKDGAHHGKQSECENVLECVGPASWNIRIAHACARPRALQHAVHASSTRRS